MSLWNNTDEAGSKPKFLNVADAAETFGVSVDEALEATNRAKGIKTPGWVKTFTYTDAQGNVRNKTETLVAFGGQMTGDVDALPQVATLVISAQPLAAAALEGETAVFSVTATASVGTLSYQWEKQEAGAGAFTPIVGATASSYTTPVLTVADDNTDVYRVVVSGSLSAAPVTSDPAVLTVTLV